MSTTNDRRWTLSDYKHSQKGNSCWKFHNSLLIDHYIELIKHRIEKNLQIIYLNIYLNIFVTVQNVFNINDKGKTVSLSSYIQKQEDKRQENKIAEINSLEKEGNMIGLS